MNFKICLVGCGSMSSHVHGPSVQAYAMLHPDVELAACCDLDPVKAERFRDTYGFRSYYTDLDEMLDAEKPDAVCLIVQEHLTATLSQHIMRKGYPLILEKPPGLTEEETTAMYETAERYGVPVQVAFNRRSMPLVSKLKKSIEPSLNDRAILHIHYDFFRVNRRDTDFSTTAIHGIDTVKYLAGADYRHIRFHYQPIPGCANEVVNIYMDCEMTSGARAALHFFPVSGVLLERATVLTKDQTFFLHLGVEHSIDYPGRLSQYAQGEAVLTHEHEANESVIKTGGFYDEHAAFFDDIRAGRKPVHDLQSGLQSVVIAQCIRRRVTEYRV